MLRKYFSSTSCSSESSLAEDRDELYVQPRKLSCDYGSYLAEGVVTKELLMITEGCGPFHIYQSDDM